jgi:general secretion pathway protein B
MSFILDALKKSEADRQRQNGPALFEVKVAPPRTRLPLWALAIVALLVVNLGIVLWLVLRHPAHAESGTLAPAAPAVAAAPLPAPPAAGAASPPPQPAPTVAATSAPPVAAASTPPAAAAATAAGSAQTTAPAAAAATTVPATARAADAGSADGGNPADYAPAEEPAPSNALSGKVRRGTIAGVPLYQDAAAVPGTQIPQLRLDLHVYAPRPEDRFVMINMHKVHPGETLPEGVHVDDITPEGAVLSYNGSRFLLPRE